MRHDTDQPVRIRFEHTRYPQIGGHSGYAQLTRHLDPARFHASLHGVSDSDTDLPSRLRRFSRPLKRLIARGGMRWYKLSDFNAEMLLIGGCLARQFEIIHFLDGEHSALILPRVRRLIGASRLRIVATFHQPPEIAREVLNLELLPLLDQVVVVSPTQLAFFKQYVAEDRIHLILHGVDTSFFHPIAHPRPAQEVRCITVGQWLRDWAAFAEVAQAMSDMTFDVVTNSRLEFSNLTNVRIHSGLEDAVLAELYRTADILFLPLIQSTANNALLEGIASGLPVVATDLEAIQAYLPSEEGILVAANRREGFIHALRRLQQDAELRHQMGSRARQRAEALAWPRMAARYEQLYRETIDRPIVSLKSAPAQL